MCRTLMVSVVAVLLLGGGASRGQDADDALRKAIDLGKLGDLFELVRVEAGPAAPARKGGPREGTLILTLRAKGAVDTTALTLKAGCFDPDGTLIRAVPLRLDGFPLEKGEAIRVVCPGLVLHGPGGRIAIRKAAGRPPQKDTPGGPGA